MGPAPDVDLEEQVRAPKGKLPRGVNCHQGELPRDRGVPREKQVRAAKSEVAKRKAGCRREGAARPFAPPCSAPKGISP